MPKITRYCWNADEENLSVFSWDLGASVVRVHPCTMTRGQLVEAARMIPEILATMDVPTVRLPEEHGLLPAHLVPGGGKEALS
jgi:hypothetical protein